MCHHRKALKAVRCPRRHKDFVDCPTAEMKMLGYKKKNI